MVDTYDLSKINLVASDLDGTLICGKYNACLVSKHSGKVLQDLEAQGVQIVLASGRPPRSMAPVLDLLQLDHPWVISCNGGIVLDSKKRTILKSFPIDHHQVFPILQKFKQFLGQDIFIGVENDLMFRCEEGYALLRGPENMNHPYTVIDRLDEFSNGPVEKIVVIHTAWKADILHKYVKEHIFSDPVWNNIINITFSNMHFIEISAVNVSKGTTLKSLCDENGYQSDQVIAFGDMPNDVEMIRFAGLGVAMANGHEDAKAAADYVTLSNMEEGVSVVLEKVLEQKSLK
ncbi:HAD-like domain-containing protein [Halteromyces radiatus]|uniref:HAD-like domain-containing protein n=1 Tax=Halteromyces radiatus TaxID=101107 RepID=UPI00222095AE|nr:HAD-like domain-containing protein [Halteromyces radiatus]KAI8099044.1 HAD-like domain-containing protein [Halteromyces radiatus]